MTASPELNASTLGFPIKQTVWYNETTTFKSSRVSLGIMFLDYL